MQNIINNKQYRNVIVKLLRNNKHFDRKIEIHSDFSIEATGESFVIQNFNNKADPIEIANCILINYFGVSYPDDILMFFVDKLLHPWPANELTIKYYSIEEFKYWFSKIAV